MAVAAEAYQLDFIDIPPPVVVIPEMQQDALVRQRAAHFIGECTVGSSVTVVESNEETPGSIGSLQEAIQLAAQGNQQAKKMVETNVATDVIERTVKAGHILQVRVDINEAGELVQYGQTGHDIQRNSLELSKEHAVMHGRTQAETRNTFRIENLLRQNGLDDSYMVVISRVPTNMSKKELGEVGFFTDTMSFVIQVISKDGDQVVIESAFVAGTTKPGAMRRDQAMVEAIGDALGVDIHDLDPTTLLDTPLLVPKQLMPNGSADLVEMADQVHGTFFGQNVSAVDYVDFRKQCNEREAQLKPTIEKITAQLIREAPQIKSKEQAIRRLGKLSEREMVKQAVFDASIDPRVFGNQAAPIILAARLEFQQGNYDAGLDLTTKAISVADSSSCPSLLKKDGSNDADSELDSDDDCEFRSEECPICKKKNVWTVVTKDRISGSCGCSVKR